MIQSIPDATLRSVCRGADCFFGTDDDYGELEVKHCTTIDPHKREHIVHACYRLLQ